METILDSGTHHSDLHHSDSYKPMLFDQLLQRQSVGALVLPAPTAEQMTWIIQSAITAPDYHRLQPWRFAWFTGEKRQVLADLYLKTERQHQTETGQVDSIRLERVQKMTFRAPVILAVCLKYQPDDKATRDDQLLSCGACVQNILLAVEALGFSAMWRTGVMTQSPFVRDYLGLEGLDDIVGYIYIGTAKHAREVRKVADIPAYLFVG